MKCTQTGYKISEKGASVLGVGLLNNRGLRSLEMSLFYHKKESLCFFIIICSTGGISDKATEALCPGLLKNTTLTELDLSALEYLTIASLCSTLI